MKDFARPLGPKYKFGAMVSEQIQLNTHFNKIYNCICEIQLIKIRLGIASKSQDGNAPQDVKVSLKMGVLMPLHAKWIVQVYESLRKKRDNIKNGFVKAGIQDAVTNADDILAQDPNPFL